MYNVTKVELEYASAIMTEEQFNNYGWGDILLGYYDSDNSWDVLQTWDIADYDKAFDELSQYRCDFTYLPDGRYYVEEYALFTYREENGDYLYGGNFELAAT